MFGFPQHVGREGSEDKTGLRNVRDPFLDDCLYFVSSSSRKFIRRSYDFSSSLKFKITEGYFRFRKYFGGSLYICQRSKTKVGCVFPMVISSGFKMEQHRTREYREDNGLKINSYRRSFLSFSYSVLFSANFDNS